MFGGQFFVGPQCAATTEDLYPSSDVNTSGWSSTPLWSKLDDQSDADFISSSSVSTVCASTTTHDFDVNFTNPSTTPGDSECQSMRVNIRLRKVQSNTGADCDVVVLLKQSTTTKATGTFNNIGTSWTTKVLTLSAAELDSITDFNNLRVEVDATMCVALDFETVSCDCAWIEIELY